MSYWVSDILMPMVAAVHQSQDCILEVTIDESSASARLIPIEAFFGEDHEEDEED